MLSCQFLQNMMASAEVIPDLQSYGKLSELTVMNSTTLFILAVHD